MHLHTIATQKISIILFNANNAVVRIVYWRYFAMKPQYELFYKQLGLNIAYYRKLRGLTQLDLAEFTDLSRTHISNIEAPNVKTRISLDTLFSIAEVLQISPKDLLDFRLPEKGRGRSMD